MPSLARVRSSQYLDVWAGLPGLVCVAQSVTYHVDDISTDAKYANPARVFPAAVGSTLPEADVDLVADLLGTGHYRASAFATFLASHTGTGRHRITWSFTIMVSDVNSTPSWFSPNRFSGLDPSTILGPYTATEEFDVVAGAASWGYCLPSDLRDEGLTTSDATDRRLATTITLATDYIKRATGNYFEPQAQIIQVDGRKGHAVMLDNPICWLEKMQVLSMFDGSALDVDLSYCRVYNRHLTDGILSPDDRNDPKIELLRVVTLLSGDVVVGLAPLASFSTWPVGVKNVQLTGVFGYTEPDGSPTGTLPNLIRHTCKLLAMREYAKMTDFDNREDRQHRGRISSESVQGYSRGYQARTLSGNFYDPEIDDLLSAFRRPMTLGVA